MDISDNVAPLKNLKESLKSFEKSCKILKSNHAGILHQFPQLIVDFVEILENIKENNYNDSKMLQIALEYHFSLTNFIEYYKNNKICDGQLVKFILNKAETLSKVYFDLISLNEFEEYEKFNLVLFEFLKTNFELTGKSDEIESIIKLTILNTEIVLGKDLSLIIFNFFIKIKKSNNYILLECIDKSLKEKEINSNLASNIFTFIFSIPNIEELKALLETKDLPFFKIKFQAIFIKFINLNLDNFNNNKELLKITLKKFNNRLFTLCSKPEVFSDFLMNIYKNDENLDIKVLSLSCLFTLISKYDFIFQNYFQNLYEILFYEGISNLSAQSLDKLLRILHLSMTSNTISFTSQASFVKKLARLCMIGSSLFICKVLKFLQVILASNKKLGFLLNKDKSIKKTFIIFEHERSNYEIMKNSVPIDLRTGEIQTSKTDENLNQKLTNFKNPIDFINKSENTNLNLIEINNSDNPKNDLFNDKEKDPDKTNSLKSGLWEIYSLLSHYNMKVSMSANKFCKYLNKNDIFFENVLEISQDKMIYDLNNKTFRFYPNEVSKTNKFIENII